jgi:hypothetical protein
MPVQLIERHVPASGLKARGCGVDPPRKARA